MPLYSFDPKRRRAGFDSTARISQRLSLAVLRHETCNAVRQLWSFFRYDFRETLLKQLDRVNRDRQDRHDR